jgi:hypothetical protein
VSSRLVFAGSKRRARVLDAEDREVARVTRELEAITQLAPLIQDEAHLQQILAECADLEHRVAVETLLTPFLRFRIQRVESPPC